VKVAFSLIVPVVGSTWLSSTVSVPASSHAGRAAAGALRIGQHLGRAAAIAFATAASDCCGKVKTTEIGCSWVIITMPVASEACTMLPHPPAACRCARRSGQ